MPRHRHHQRHQQFFPSRSRSGKQRVKKIMHKGHNIWEVLMWKIRVLFEMGDILLVLRDGTKFLCKKPIFNLSFAHSGVN